MLTLLQAVSQFILLADASELVPNLSNNRSYSDFHLSQRDWDRLENIKAALRVSSVLPYLIWCSCDLGRSHQMFSKHSRVYAHPLSGELYLALSSSSNVGKPWPRESNFKV